MKRHILLFIPIFYIVLNLRAQDAENLLRASHRKCLSVSSGQIEFIYRHQTSSPNEDTLLSQLSVQHSNESAIFSEHLICTFKKAPQDSHFPLHFHTIAFYQHDYTSENAYDGKEFIRASAGDSVARVSQATDWTNEMDFRAQIVKRYHMLTDTNAQPLLLFSRPDYESTDLHLKEVEMVNGSECYVVEVIIIPENDPEAYELVNRTTQRFWIRKSDSIPVKYEDLIEMVTDGKPNSRFTAYELTKDELNIAIDEKEFGRTAIKHKDKFVDDMKRLQPLQAGIKAPDWKLADLNGNSIVLSEQHPKLLLLDFYFMNCQPCKEAIPHLQNMQEKYGKNGLQIIGIDPVDKNTEALKSFVDVMKMTYPTVIADKELSISYGVDGFPVLFYINDQGEVLRADRGFGVGSVVELEKHIKEFLGLRE